MNHRMIKHTAVFVSIIAIAIPMSRIAKANTCENGCFVYSPGDNWGFQVGGGDANNIVSEGSAAYLSGSPSNNSGGVQTGDDVSQWLGLRDNQTYDSCAPGYSPNPCNSISSPSGTFIQSGIAHDYPNQHGLFAQTSWRGRVDCGPNASKTVYDAGFTSTNPSAITYDCSVANPSLDGYDLTNGSWVEIIPQYGDRVNIYVGNTWIMALFDSSSDVSNTQLLLETNLYGSPSAEIGSGVFDFASSRTVYLSGGQWIDYPPPPQGGASAWGFYMSTLDVRTQGRTFGNNPCMFYDPNTLPHWVGTQAGFGSVTSSMEAGRDVVDCWYDNGVIIHTGIQRPSSPPIPSPMGGKTLVPPPFPSHRSPYTPPSKRPAGTPVPTTLPAIPTPAAPGQPNSPYSAPVAPPVPTVMPPRTPTPGPAAR